MPMRRIPAKKLLFNFILMGLFCSFVLAMNIRSRTGVTATHAMLLTSLEHYWLERSINVSPPHLLDTVNLELRLSRPLNDDTLWVFYTAKQVVKKQGSDFPVWGCTGKLQKKYSLWHLTSGGCSSLPKFFDESIAPIAGVGGFDRDLTIYGLLGDDISQLDVLLENGNVSTAYVDNGAFFAKIPIGEEILRNTKFTGFKAYNTHGILLYELIW